ncbi:MAG: nucleotidyltransferase family protein [Deltaproteobacteria bacterium]|nr:nucleotidyltransferase family protein [Deltaproteobacteria bacterium]
MTATQDRDQLHGLVWSMRAERDRALLCDLGAKVGTPVLFLKGAFAEPVLYGNRGLRTGCDIDVLIDPAAFVAFEREVLALGWLRREFPTHPVTNRLLREWMYAGRDGHIDLDLHRQLAQPPWYHIDTKGCLARAVRYEAGQTTVWSLCPEDQVLFTAAHYANHAFTIDAKHFEDTVRLAQTQRINWRAVHARARQGGLGVALALLLDALGARGVEVPLGQRPLAGVDHFRKTLAEHLVRATPRGFVRGRELPSPWDALATNVLVSTRPAALVRFVVEYAGLRLLDHGHRFFWGGR